MHMAWMRHIGGRLKSDYRYSIGLVYNTFPTPPADQDIDQLTPLAQSVLDARTQYRGSTFAELYDPDVMPTSLRHAHHALDKAVDKLYRRPGFSADRERVEHLFGLYERIVSPLAMVRTASTKKKKRTRQGAAAPESET